MGDLTGVVFEIAAQRKGEHWRLGDDEKAAWGNAMANVLRHVPMPEKQMGIAADIAAVGFVAYASLVPRINMDRAITAHNAAARTEPAVPADPREVLPTIPFAAGA